MTYLPQALSATLTQMEAGRACSSSCQQSVILGKKLEESGTDYSDSQVPTLTMTGSTETWTPPEKIEISPFGKNASYAPLCEQNA